ncbi:hypothetical protein [Arthrobacter sp. H5]|uniref:hypothetical protein n=1 Tax=Arthrobacter sp. H5 TaxID=1267973 RepID=UPI000485D7B4|nr:hypothetical protein [Arthrobacter sp. H5]
MSATPRRRYRIRRAVAGSLLAASSLAGLGAAPAVALDPVSSGKHDDGERLRGVRTDLDAAVGMGHVTTAQASRFYDQIARRVAAGL